MVTPDLVAFLHARLDEDEATARIVGSGGYEPPTWHAGDDPHRASWMPLHAEDRLIGAPADHAERDHDPFALVANRRAEWAHIIRWDPARVLAEVDAKRRIIAEHPSSHIGGDLYECKTCGQWPYPCETIALLALPYNTHNDYQKAWAP